MNFEPHEYTLSRHWVCPLEYGDVDNLSRDDERLLKAFLAELPAPDGWWAWDDEETDFARDEITGLWADCVRAKYMVPT